MSTGRQRNCRLADSLRASAKVDWSTDEICAWTRKLERDMRVAIPMHLSDHDCVDLGIAWQPPIGDRVRIRPDLDDRCPEGAHDANEPGHTGIVVNVRGACGGTSHPYLVLFDEPHPV